MKNLPKAIINLLCSPLPPTQKHTQIANEVVQQMDAHGAFYHLADMKTFDTAMYFTQDTKRLMRIASDEFLAWLSDVCQMNMSLPSFKYIVSAVQQHSIAGKTTQPVEPEKYWARRKDKIYMSCGDGHMVRITPKSYDLVDNGTDNVLFVSGSTLQPWEVQGDTHDPFKTLRVFTGMQTDSTSFHLFKTWVCCLPTGVRCKPPLVLTGPVRSGKTKAITSVFDLYGMPSRIGDAVEEGSRDLNFWVSVDAGGLFVLDNVDQRVPWLPDAVARASTDGSKERRKLHTDNTIIRLHARAWVTITSSNPTFGSDLGLSDRLIVVPLERRTESLSESALKDEILQHRDPSLRWIVHLLHLVLKDKKKVPEHLNIRHPEFAQTAVRVGRALGEETLTVEALRYAERAKAVFNIENDILGSALLTTLRERVFEGTAKDLLGMLAQQDSHAFNDRYWSPKIMGRRLSVIWPHLQVLCKADRFIEDGIIKFKLEAVSNGASDPLKGIGKKPKKVKKKS